MTKHSIWYFIILLAHFTNVLTAQINKTPQPSYWFNPEIGSITTGDLPEWVSIMYNTPQHIEKIKSLYEEYYESHSFEKNQHTQFYKRLLRQHSRISHNINVESKEEYITTQEAYLKKRAFSNKTSNQWDVVGPYDLDIDAMGTGNTPGTAHIYHVDYCRGLTQHMLAGTATAGLWKSSNSGNSWDLITRDLPVTEVKAAAYQANNPSRIFFTANNNFYKTIDGGYNWSVTGGEILENTFFSGSEILIDDQHDETIYLATNIGLFKSIDLGENFELILSGNIQDIEFHPVNHDVVYAIKAEFNKTTFWRTDDASSFQQFDAGYPAPDSNEEQKRTRIAVSADEPDALWAIAVGKVNLGDGLVGIYKSSDKGSQWHRQCCGEEDGGPASISNPNVMEWECGGENDGGQYYYDLAIAVNPNDRKELITGGINLWNSSDGGMTMNCLSDFIYKKSPETYVHADIHCIVYIEGKIWVASDGGIFVSEDHMQSFHKKMHGIVGTDFRGFDVGFNDREIMVGGTYHNGTFLRENDTYVNDWVSTRSGDNIRAFVNDGDNSIIYDHSSMRELSGSRDELPHNIAISRKPNASFVPGESSEIVFDPSNFNTIYLGQHGSLYRSNNNGINFETVKNFGSGYVTAIEKSTTNPFLMYVVHYPSFSSPKKIMRSTDGGASFQDVTPPSSMFEDQNLWVAMDITIGSHNPFEIWMARVPQTTNGLNLDGMQVFYSANGGDTWINWSSGELDGEFPTNIVHQQGSDGLVYLGTRRGVYYRSANSGDWTLLNNNLPAACYSTKLIAHNKSAKLINATTRGVYEIDFVEASTAIAVPMVDKQESDCLRDTFYFMDRSPVEDVSVTRNWTFLGADVEHSTEKYPKITYAEPGTYPVSLSVAIPGSSASYHELEFITVNDGCGLDSLVGSAVRVGNGAYARVPSYKREFSEMTISAWVKWQGVIYDIAGVVLHRDGPQGTGLTIKSDGQLSFLWNELSNDHESGLIVPFNKWSHVAMAVTETEVRLYVDGKESIIPVNLSSVELLDNFFIGGDEFSITHYLNGYIDEVSIYDKALDAEDIRLNMNVTHMDSMDGLLSYFQANNSEGRLTDRVGHSHAYMMNNATRESSQAAVSAGCAEEHIIDLPGTYDFECAEVSLTFDETDILPMGPVSIAKLNILPNMPLPEGTKLSENYWVINNGGANETFSAPAIAEFRHFGQVDSLYEEYPELYKFYKVPAYWEYGWGNYSDEADSINFLDNTTLSYENPPALTSGGKILLVEEGFGALAYAKIDLRGHIVDNTRRKLLWEGIDNAIQYSVERSVGGHEWDLIEKIPCEINRKGYEFIDTKRESMKYYYRVAAIDVDNNVTYSNIISLELVDESAIRLLPNVVKQYGDVTIHNPRLFDSRVSIYDMEGRLMSRFTSNQERNIFNVNFPRGQYVVEVVLETTTLHHILIVQ